MSGSNFYIYRCTAIGLAFEQTLQELVDSGELGSTMKDELMSIFDESFLDEMKGRGGSTAMLSGHLDTYQEVYPVWKFWVRDAHFISNTEELSFRMLKIMAIENVSGDTADPPPKKKTKNK